MVITTIDQNLAFDIDENFMHLRIGGDEIDTK